MGYPAVTYTFVNGPTQIIDADAVNTNFDDIIKGISDGTKNINVNQVSAADLILSGKVISSLLPYATNTYDLGSVALKFRSIYAGTSITVTGPLTCGDFTTTGSVYTSLIPAGLSDLGSNSNPWENIYASNLTVSVIYGPIVLNGALTILGAGITAAGSVSASALIPTGATVPANGVYLPAANQLGFSTNTTLQGSISSAGLWTVGASSGTQTHVINGGFTTTKGCSIGGTANAFTGLAFNGTGLGLTGTGQIGISMLYSFDAAVATGAYTAFFAQPISRSTTGTCAAVRYFYAKTANKGATDTWTRHTIFLTDAPVAGANNCVLSDNESYSGNWYINQSGTTNSQFGGLVGVKQATDNVTDAGPTQAEMVTALGAANQLNAGIGAIKDANADTNFFLCMTNGTSWYYLKLTKGT